MSTTKDSSKLYVVLNYGPATMMCYGQDRTTFTPKLKGLGCRWTAKLKEGFTKVITGGWLIPKKNFDRLKEICKTHSIVIEEEKLRELKPASSSRHHELSREIETPKGFAYSDSDDDDNYHRSLSAIKDVIASGKNVKKLSKKQQDRRKNSYVSSYDESLKVKEKRKHKSESQKKKDKKSVSRESSYDSSKESRESRESRESKESKESKDSRESKESRESRDSKESRETKRDDLPSNIDSEEEDCKSLAKHIRKIVKFLRK